MTTMPAISEGDLPPLPQLLGNRYELEDQLGRGGMGIVFRCLDREQCVRRAAKLLTGRLAGEAQERERFEQEAKLLTRFQHPNILRVCDYGIEGEYPYLITELCLTAEGTPSSLANLMVSSPHRQVSGALLDALIPPVIGALADLHNEGLVHRDIKPGNILLHQPAEGELLAKLSDFGLVALTGDAHLREMAEFSMSMNLEQESAQGMALVGTYSYMSPEQKRGEVIDARSDVYSFGLMLYRLATGYDRISFALPSEIVEGLPTWIDAIVKASVDGEKEHRAASAEELFALLPPAYQERLPRLTQPDRRASLQKAREERRDRQNESVAEAEEAVLLDEAEPPVEVRGRPRKLKVGLVMAAVGLVLGIGWFLLADKEGEEVPSGERVAGIHELLASNEAEALQLGMQRLRTASSETVARFRPRLIELLAHPDVTVRRMATTVMGDLGEAHESFRSPLLAQLEDADEVVVLYALQAIRRWQPAPDEAVARVHGLFARAQGKARQEAAATLAVLPVPLEPRYADYFLYDGKVEPLVALGDQLLPELKQALTSNDRGVQYHALQVFERLGESARPAAPLLLPLLGNEDRDLRTAAEAALLAIGPTIAGDLLGLLRSGNEYARSAAVQVLSRMEPAIPEVAWAPYYVQRGDSQAVRALGSAAVPVLMTGFADSGSAYQQQVLTLLWSLGTQAAEAAPALAEYLERHHRTSGGEAIMATLGAIGPGAGVARPIILDILRESSPDRAQAAAQALAAIGVPAQRENLAYFLWSARHAPTIDTQLTAIRELGNIGGASGQAREYLALVLAEGEDERLAEAASLALAAIGEPAVPLLRSLLSRQSRATRRAIDTLGRIGPPAQSAVDELGALMGVPQDDIRRAALEALGRIGEASVPLLLKALGMPQNRSQAATALAQIGAPALLRLRNELLNTPDRSYRSAAILTIGLMGEAAAPAVIDLRKALGSPEKYDNREVLRALGRIGPAAAPALPEVAPYLQSSSEELRQSAIRCMAGIGARGIPYLGRALSHDTLDVREGAMAALQELGPQSAIALPQLERAYESGNATTRERVIAVLGSMGSGERRHLPLLERALRDEDPRVRMLAVQILSRLGAGARSLLPALEELRAREASDAFRQAITQAIDSIRAQ